MTDTKAKPSEAIKPATEIKKPGLQIKPIKDLEPNQSQSEDVRGGNGAGGYGPGFLFSDAALKSEVAAIKDSLAKLRAVRF